MDVDDRVREIEIEMAAHESQCEERWKTTFNRLNDIDEHLARIESRIIAGGGATLIFLMRVACRTVDVMRRGREKTLIIILM